MKRKIQIGAVLAATLILVIVIIAWRRSVNRERQARARDLMDSALLIATACQSAGPDELRGMQAQLEKDEAQISKDMGWDDGPPWWDLTGKVGAERSQAKAAFHNRLVRWGCFKN